MREVIDALSWRDPHVVEEAIMLLDQDAYDHELRVDRSGAAGGRSRST
jgi:hypothetical protein